MYIRYFTPGYHVSTWRHTLVVFSPERPEAVRYGLLHTRIPGCSIWMYPVVCMYGTYVHHQVSYAFSMAYVYALICHVIPGTYLGTYQI